jgi:hypothetical protein
MSKRSIPPPAGSPGARSANLARRRVLLTIRELDAATDEANNLLAHAMRRTLGVGQQIERGASVLEVTYSTGMSEQRTMLNEAILRIEGARHQFHRSMFLLAAAEGNTKAEIARAWGVSRQLVSRMVKGRIPG